MTSLDQDKLIDPKLFVVRLILLKFEFLKFIGLRMSMLSALRLFYEYSSRGGMFINSCFAHCQSESQDTWFAENSPTIDNKVRATCFFLEAN